MDEVGIQDTSAAYWRQQAEMAVASFRRKRLRAEYVPDRQAARERVLSLIPSGATIGRGDSITIEQIGVLPMLKRSGDHEVFDPYVWNEDGSNKVIGEERLRLKTRALTADVFLSGANAITLDGKVVATDSGGNRVAAMIFGPRKIIIVAGINKLVPDLDAALRRIHGIAAPMDLRHHATHHSRPEWLDIPCVKAGKCPDCAHAGRGCNFTIVIEGSRETPLHHSDDHTHRHNIILVGESLGF
ncbi:MAG: lactate utilization protein [Chloroflexi bacterium]|nr:lactate utilization protein [Chloroflexota bacterium]